MSDLEYEMAFLKRHGLLPEQAIDRIAELEAQLRDIALTAKPVAATAKNTSAVRTGHELGGYIKHYIVPTHLITAIKGEAK